MSDTNNNAKSMVTDDNYLNENKDNLNEQQLFHHYAKEKKQNNAKIDDDHRLHVKSSYDKVCTLYIAICILTLLCTYYIY